MNQDINKKYHIGMVLGKFYPFHNGHKFLIDVAIKNCEKVVVYACSLPSESIGPAARYNSICKTYKNNKNVTVLNITDILPQDPTEDENFWEIWYNVVYNNLPYDNLDAIFGSEDYIIKFSEVLCVDGIIVDKERTTVPISGTAVRSDIIKNWKYLPLNTKIGLIYEKIKNLYSGNRISR